MDEKAEGNAVHFPQIQDLLVVSCVLCYSPCAHVCTLTAHKLCIYCAPGSTVKKPGLHQIDRCMDLQREMES